MAKKIAHQTERTRRIGQRQAFSLAAPGAKNVQLVGDFTNWQEQPVAMQKNSDGVWHVTLNFSPGQHRYRFLVNGEWRDNPECGACVPNPFGTQDAVRQVGKPSPQLLTA